MKGGSTSLLGMCSGKDRRKEGERGHKDNHLKEFVKGNRNGAAVWLRCVVRGSCLFVFLIEEVTSCLHGGSKGRKLVLKLYPWVGVRGWDRVLNGRVGFR